MSKVSAGLLMFRKTTQGRLEFFLVHPGGPYFKNKDDGVWDIPKGETEQNGGNEELLFDAARREFEEETSIAPPLDLNRYIPLGENKIKSGKIIHIWAFENNFNGVIKSNEFQLEWPPKSGKFIRIPEVDRGAYFDFTAASKKLSPEKFEFCRRLQQHLNHIEH